MSGDRSVLATTIDPGPAAELLPDGIVVAGPDGAVLLANSAACAILRLEREDQDRMALRLRGRSEEEYQLVEYRDRRDREIIPIVERNPSPPRNVIRVEKDRKGRMALVRSAH